MNHYHNSTALRRQVIHLGVRKTWTTKKIRIAESGQNLLNRISFAVNRLGYSKRTEQTYSYWIKYFLNYNRTKPAQGLCIEDINRFLQHISNRNKSPTSVNVAINAINFFFKHVLELEMGQLDPIHRPKAPKKSTCCVHASGSDENTACDARNTSSYGILTLRLRSSDK